MGHSSVCDDDIEGEGGGERGEGGRKKEKERGRERERERGRERSSDILKRCNMSYSCIKRLFINLLIVKMTNSNHPTKQTYNINAMPFTHSLFTCPCKGGHSETLSMLNQWAVHGLTDPIQW